MDWMLVATMLKVYARISKTKLTLWKWLDVGNASMQTKMELSVGIVLAEPLNLHTIAVME
jgi:hypothetical protein